MAFTQFTLDKATNQARGIFDQYVYSTSDSIADTQAAGYFLQSRFINDPDWVGSLITCKCSDGIYEGEIQSSGTVAPIPAVDNITLIFADTTSGPDTVTIQTADIIDDALFIIKDEFGNASINNVTIDAQGGETIDGVSSVNIEVDYGVVRLMARSGNLLSW